MNFLKFFGLLIGISLLSHSARCADPHQRPNVVIMIADVVALDQAVGRVLDKLKQTGLAEKTVVFFFSDNGGHPENRSENLPLKGYKFENYEGGIRVPFFAMYPGMFPAGLEYKSPVSAMDILPTCAALASVCLPDGLDGINLTPYLQGVTKTPPHPTLFWGGQSDAVVHRGDWNYIFSPKAKAGELFNLGEDPFEKTDLSANNSALVAQLDQAWREWNAQLPPPQNGGKKDKKNEHSEEE